ncbi:DUF413 domain-containing protein [Ferrimonas marina]|uniref:Macrodomain Ori protein n=1 Tax=Ferrimonas marina TaxID=299255 RepID=A0A1M5ZL74_9GAMM|nr:DUF413 domain-containing protein [Ferrimonas marina]SHI25057.1 hypothetical protein SAMN02745129_0420 [Ferrimonas marina]
MSASQSFSCVQKFFDDRHFPRGFRRSGSFTITEADLLESCGFAMQELSEGKREPICPEEEAFVQFAQGARPAETQLEKIWAKYLKASKGKRIHTVGNAAPSTGGRAPAKSVAALTAE